MKITINSENINLSFNITNLSELIDDLSLDKNKIAIEINKDIIFPEKYHSYKLKEGDNIEIIYFVGGG